MCLVRQPVFLDPIATSTGSNSIQSVDNARIFDGFAPSGFRGFLVLPDASIYLEPQRSVVLSCTMSLPTFVGYFSRLSRTYRDLSSTSSSSYFFSLQILEFAISQLLYPFAAQDHFESIKYSLEIRSTSVSYFLIANSPFISLASLVRGQRDKLTPRSQHTHSLLCICDGSQLSPH